ncbi:MAG: LysR family transcriptional regulator [Solirubrobacterales bacterium]|nr:LysR family transcriptional regulator [Solirubrobacterales bacterium]
MLNLARLQVFREVVTCGSFSAAADALSYTQSAVSQSVARLEAETGAALVVRDRKGVRPTEAGATLLRHAELILTQARAAEAELDAILGLRAGRLRVASFPSGGETLMPPAVARFRRAHPEVALTLVEGEPEEIGPRIRSGDVDLGLLYEFPGAHRAGLRPSVGLRARRLLDDPMHVALPAEHPLVGVSRLRLADLCHEQWVQTSSTSPCARHVVRTCLDSGFAPDVAFESDDYDTVQGLVAAGVGVALIPQLALSRLHSGVVVRSLTPSSPSRRVTVATLPGAGVAPAARSMIQVLSDVAARHRERARSTDPAVD